MKRILRSIICVMLSVAMILSSEAFVSNAYALSSISESTRAKSKKGIQISPGEMEKAIEMGCSTVFVNFSFTDYIRTTSVEGETTFKGTDGKIYEYPIWVLEDFNRWFSYGRQNGIDTIYVQVMSRKLPGLTDTTNSGAAYHAFDVWTENGRKNVEKMFGVISKYLGANVDYWIIGNEVDNPHVYYEAGNMSESDFAVNYEKTMKIMDTAAKKYNKNARVMACFDYFWTMTAPGHYNTKNILDKIISLTANRNYDWGVAIHPYPDPLTSPNFADDTNAGHCSNDVNTGIITMCNLDIFTNYMQGASRLYNSGVRPIAITEIGFTAIDSSTINQYAQAAFYAYAYYKAEANKFIDAFHMRCYQDAPEEVVQGLSFGLYDLNGNKRLIYDVMKYIDTPAGSTYSEKYLGYLGVSSWKQLVPGYDSLPFVAGSSFTGLAYDKEHNYYFYLKNGKIDSTCTGLIASNGYVAYIEKGIGVDSRTYEYIIKLGEAGKKYPVTIKDDTKVEFISYEEDGGIASVSTDGVITTSSVGSIFLDIISYNNNNSGLAEVKLTSTAPYKDVKAADYFREYTDYLYTKGIMTGYNDNRLGPKDNITRAQMVTMLWRLEGEPEVESGIAFPDVAENDYYTKAVAWASSNGIVKGYEDKEKAGLFGTKDPIKRQDVAIILSRYAAYKGLNTTVYDTEAYKECADYKTVSDYALSAVQWAYNHGVMGVDSDLKPNANIYRCDMAIMLVRTIQNLGI